MLGADVLHVESTARPDGTRLLAGLPFSEDDWWERSGIFAGLNTNKRSVTLDLTDEPGRALLRRLLETCDVLVENYTRSEEHTSELQSLMRSSYAVFCLKKKTIP